MNQLQSILSSLVTFLRQNAEWVIISLILGFVIWIVAVLDDNPVQQRTLPQRVGIEFIEGEDVVRSSNATRTARVTLRAPRSTFDEIATDDIRLTADLSSLEPGTHVVELDAEIINEDLRGRVVEIDPPEISVDVVAVGERLIQVNPIIISPSSARATAACEPNEVRVRGPSPEISSIISADVRIDIADQPASATADYSILLIGPDGRTINTLNTDPETVSCTVTIEQRDDTATVKVIPNIVGSVPEGYIRLDPPEVDPEEIEVTGNQDALDALGGEVMTEVINAEGQTENFSRVVGVELPDGVELVQSTQRITVTITITEPNTTVNFENVEIQVLNLGGGLEVELSPATVTVSITGPPSLVDELTEQDISVSVDVEGLDIGIHTDLPLTWEGLRASLQDPEIPVIIQPETVDVTITERVVPTPTPLGIIG